MKIDTYYKAKAEEIHKTCPVVDTHLDLAGELVFRLRNGEENPLRDIYLPAFRKGGFDLIVSSVYLQNHELPEGGLRAALEQIVMLKEQIRKNPEFLEIRSVEDLDRCLKDHRIGIILYMEGLDCIGSDVRLLTALWELGVRGASLTWSRRNLLASGCCKASECYEIRGGLSPEGFDVVREMERLRMFVDVSHLNDDGFENIRETAIRPFMATHSNSREVAFHYRNLTDTQMQILADQGGIAGLNGYVRLVSETAEEEYPDENGVYCLEKLCMHVEHMVEVMGPEHVGYGFDFCDSYTAAERMAEGQPHYADCLLNHGNVPLLTAALLQRGMNEEAVRKIVGENFVQYFRKMLPKTS